MRGCFQCFLCPGKPTISTPDDMIVFQFVEQVSNNSFNDDKDYPLSILSAAEAVDVVLKINSQASRVLSNCKFSENPELLQPLVNDFRKKQAQVLNDFRETLTESFLRAFEVALEQQRSMLEDLHVQSEKLDQKLKHVKSWKKLCKYVYVATSVGALICSVVLVAMTAPSSTSSAPESITSGVVSLGEWLNKVWKNYEVKIMDEKEMVDDLGEKISICSVVVDEMDGIRAAVNNLENKIQAMRSKAKALNKEIKDNADEFTASLAVLEKVVQQLEKDLWWISAMTAGDNPYNLLSYLWITLQAVLSELESKQKKEEFQF